LGPGLLISFSIITIVLGPIIIGVTYSLLKHRTVNKQELRELQDNIGQIRADIEEIKEQIADYIIKTS